MEGAVAVVLATVVAAVEVALEAAAAEEIAVETVEVIEANNPTFNPVPGIGPAPFWIVATPTSHGETNATNVKPQDRKELAVVTIVEAAVAVLEAAGVASVGEIVTEEVAEVVSEAVEASEGEIVTVEVAGVALEAVEVSEGVIVEAAPCEVAVVAVIDIALIKNSILVIEKYRSLKRKARPPTTPRFFYYTAPLLV